MIFKPAILSELLVYVKRAFDAKTKQYALMFSEGRFNLLISFNIYHAMGRFSRQQTNDIFFLMFLENRIWNFMQIVS